MFLFTPAIMWCTVMTAGSTKSAPKTSVEIDGWMRGETMAPVFDLLVSSTVSFSKRKEIYLETNWTNFLPPFLSDGLTNTRTNDGLITFLCLAVCWRGRRLQCPPRVYRPSLGPQNIAPLVGGKYQSGRSVF